METPIIKLSATAEMVAEQVAKDFLGFTKRCIEETGSCIVALSGGSTPNALFSILSSDAYREAFDWEHICFIWVDERFVPQSDKENNYGKAKEILFNNLSGPKHVCPVPTDVATVEAAARQYEKEVDTILKAYQKEAVDLALMGLGDDGHTASLFPRSEALQVWDRNVAYVRDGKNWDRITLTIPFLMKSAHMWFTVVGEGKKAALGRVLRQYESYRNDDWQSRVERTLPAAIFPLHKAIFYVDEAANPSR